MRIPGANVAFFWGGGSACVSLKGVAHPWPAGSRDTGGFGSPAERHPGVLVLAAGAGRSRIQTWDWGNWFGNYGLAGSAPSPWSGARPAAAPGRAGG